MTVWDFASEHWFVALLIVWSVAKTFCFCVALPIRAINIYKHGWPPAPLDADGDIHYPDTESD